MGATSTPIIFVWHPGSLGDVLMARPAILALRAAYPHHDLLLAAQAEIGRLLHTCDEVDGRFSLDHPALAALYAGSHPVQGAIGEVLGRCKAAVCWLADQDGRVRQALERLGIPRLIIRSPHDAEVQSLHQSERFLETLSSLETSSRSWEALRLPVDVGEEGRRRLGSVRGARGQSCAMIHAGSGSPHKCCNPTLLVELITRLRDQGISPVLVVGPADGEAAARLRDLLPFSMASFQGEDLVAVAGLLAAADLYIGHDSGLSHLAAALGVPTVAMFGPTLAERWAPRGPTVTALSGPPCRCDGWPEIRSCTEKPCLSIPVETVLAACHHALQSRPRAKGSQVMRLP